MTAETNLLQVSQSGRLWTKDVWQRTAVRQKASRGGEVGEKGGTCHLQCWTDTYTSNHTTYWSSCDWKRLKCYDPRYFKAGQTIFHMKRGAQWHNARGYHIITSVLYLFIYCPRVSNIWKLREDYNTSNTYMHRICILWIQLSNTANVIYK